MEIVDPLKNIERLLGISIEWKKRVKDTGISFIYCSERADVNVVIFKKNPLGIYTWKAFVGKGMIPANAHNVGAYSLKEAKLQAEEYIRENRY